jgi:hypothetical protein
MPEGALEFVKVLRELSRRKKLVALVLAISLFTGFILAFKPGFPPQSRQYQVWLASSDVLVDTRNSQVVAVGGLGADLSVLTGRANLIGSLTTSGELKNAIAKSAGIPANELVVVPPTGAPGLPPAPVVPAGAKGLSDADTVKLSTSIAATLPILHVTAQAPSRETALKLSRAVIVALKEYLSSVAASQKVPAAHRLVVREFGAPVAGVATRGLPRRFALAATAILALLGCGAIIGASWLVRSWKQIEEAEGRGAPGGDPPAIRSLAGQPSQPAPKADEPPALGLRR